MIDIMPGCRIGVITAVRLPQLLARDNLAACRSKFRRVWRFRLRRSVGATLRLDANRPQQEGRKMPQIRRFVARALWRVREAPWTEVADGSNLFLTPRGGGGFVATREGGRAPVVAPTTGRRFLLLNHRIAGPWYGLADEFFYRNHRFLIAGRHDGNRCAASSRATRTADAMYVIVGVVRDIEIEDMTDIGNIEAPRCYVGGHKQRHFVFAKLLQCGRAGLLVHIPMERDGGKSMANERAMQGRDFTLPVAENNCVLETDGCADESAQGLPFFGRFAAGSHQNLRGGSNSAGGTGNLHADRLVKKLLGDSPDLGRHGGGEEQRLAGKRNELADAFDVRDETHIQHAVGFIDDEKLDAGHQKPATLAMIEQTARGGDQHVDATHQLAILIVV